MCLFQPKILWSPEDSAPAYTPEPVSRGMCVWEKGLEQTWPESDFWKAPQFPKLPGNMTHEGGSGHPSMAATAATGPQR